jgi:carbamoyl-phosphate synthase large subunit
VVATGGTADYLKAEGLDVEPIKKVLEGRPNILDAIKNGEIDLVFNTTEGKQSLSDSFSLRRATLMQKIPYYTTASGAVAATRAIKSGATELLDVRPIQEYA